ncbi:hypothetical protein DFJ73DRAFT_862202 [Zopfochytrium polystomum]|nr:hypothetical protein DFJ73DRAFT_862202 [Zopfochytrium polystomum]
MYLYPTPTPCPKTYPRSLPQHIHLFPSVHPPSPVCKSTHTARAKAQQQRHPEEVGLLVGALARGRDAVAPLVPASTDARLPLHGRSPPRHALVPAAPGIPAAARSAERVDRVHLDDREVDQVHQVHRHLQVVDHRRRVGRVREGGRDRLIHDEADCRDEVDSEDAQHAGSEQPGRKLRDVAVLTALLDVVDGELEQERGGPNLERRQRAEVRGVDRLDDESGRVGRGRVVRAQAEVGQAPAAQQGEHAPEDDVVQSLAALDVQHGDELVRVQRQPDLAHRPPDHFKERHHAVLGQVRLHHVRADRGKDEKRVGEHGAQRREQEQPLVVARRVAAKEERGEGEREHVDEPVLLHDAAHLRRRRDGVDGVAHFCSVPSLLAKVEFLASASKIRPRLRRSR